jgi:hypothetical protein
VTVVSSGSSPSAATQSPCDSNFAILPRGCAYPLLRCLTSICGEGSLPFDSSLFGGVAIGLAGVRQVFIHLTAQEEKDEDEADTEVCEAPPSG